MQQKASEYLGFILCAAAAVGGIWLAVRFVLPWTAPFIVAFGMAAVFERPVRSMVRHGWARPAASGVLSLFALALIVLAAVRLISHGASAVSGFAAEVPQLMAAAGDSLEALEAKIMHHISQAPDGVSAYLETAVDSLTGKIYSLPSLISSWALDAAARAAQSTPDTVLFVVTAGIGGYFISAAFPQITAFLLLQLPARWKEKLSGLGNDLRGSFGGWLRAQLILMAMTFFELMAAFLLLDIDGAAVIAAVTALIDALPVFGTGIVLVPWALYSLLLGDFARGIGLIISWGIVTLVRSCVQAKLLGDQIGLDPVSSLLAIYIGWRVWGVWGMLLFPILFVTLRQLNDKGIIRLWKSP